MTSFMNRHQPMMLHLIVNGRMGRYEFFNISGYFKNKDDMIVATGCNRQFGYGGWSPSMTNI